MGEQNFLSEWGKPDWFEDSILLGYRGSIAHGMYVPKNDPNSIDDKDVMGIIIPGKEYYYGIEEWGSRGTKEIKKDEWDIVLYEFRKMIALLSKGNPNVLSLLWLENEDYIRKTLSGIALIKNRNLFSSVEAFHSFIGYAYGQLHRTHCAFEGYMGEKRKQLVEKFGYDCKNAAHLIRLLRMGTEFMQEGELHVKRRMDATQLLEIKNGEWTLEQVKEEAAKWFDRAYEAKMNTKLPAKVDRDKINKLCIEICGAWFGDM